MSLYLGQLEVGETDGDFDTPRGPAPMALFLAQQLGGRRGAGRAAAAAAPSASTLPEPRRLIGHVFQSPASPQPTSGESTPVHLSAADPAKLVAAAAAAAEMAPWRVELSRPVPPMPAGPSPVPAIADWAAPTPKLAEPVRLNLPPGLALHVPPGLPAPPAVAAPAAGGAARALAPRTSQFAENTVVSSGSLGHPHKCAEACPYVKRKGGCRDGAECTKCHLCFWRRAQDPADAASAPVPPPPQQVAPRPRAPALAQPVKPGLLIREVGPDRGSVGTTACALRLLGPVVRPDLCTGAAEADLVTADAAPSVGSIGHPDACGEACKYNKGRGCKDGRWCVRCHLCRWHRFQAEAKDP